MSNRVMMGAPFGPAWGSGRGRGNGHHRTTSGVGSLQTSIRGTYYPKPNPVQPPSTGSQAAYWEAQLIATDQEGHNILDRIQALDEQSDLPVLTQAQITKRHRWLHLMDSKVRWAGALKKVLDLKMKQRKLQRRTLEIQERDMIIILYVCNIAKRKR